MCVTTFALGVTLTARIVSTDRQSDSHNGGCHNLNDTMAHDLNDTVAQPL